MRYRGHAGVVESLDLLRFAVDADGAGEVAVEIDRIMEDRNNPNPNSAD